jgi:hypothetical protein
VWALRGGAALGIFRWDGATWTDHSAFAPVPPPSDAPPATLAGTYEPGPVWGATTDNLWMAGIINYPNYPTGPNASGSMSIVGYAHWDGVSWTVFGPATLTDARQGAAYQITGSSANDLWVVGQAPSFVDHFDGTAWRRLATFADAEIYSHVWASCPSNVWISGLVRNGVASTSPLLRHYDGRTWSTVTLTFLPASGGLNGIGGVPGHDLWVGFASSSGVTAAGYVYHRPL